jgi:DNA polymerase III alpha subunit
MKFDKYGQTYTTSKELCNLLYQNPKLDLSLFQVEDTLEYNRSVADLHADQDLLEKYQELTDSIDEFDRILQSSWSMPQEYKDMDIAKYVLDLCRTDQELQRVGEELLLYQERNLFDLLRYLKYMIDTLRKNNIVWGVGRGSSVASYVLFLLGVHKIDSLYYNLSVDEFLK